MVTRSALAAIFAFAAASCAHAQLSPTPSANAAAPQTQSASIWGALSDIPNDKVRALAQKLYALGYGPNDRYDIKNRYPDWVDSNSMLHIDMAIKQWRKATNTTVAGTSITTAEIDSIMQATTPAQWAAVAFGGAGDIERFFPSARTWNRPSRELAERVVIDRCAAKHKANAKTPDCSRNVRVFSGKTCATLMLKWTDLISTRPGENGERLVEPLFSTGADQDAADTAVLTDCHRRENARCTTRHTVCTNGSKSF